jgi:thiol-disulfide isomerase/thioredoxin
VPSERRACAALALAAISLAAGCRERAPSAADAPTERFAGVRKAAASAAAPSAFCERSYPAGGEGARRWVAPPLRPLPGADATGGAAAGTGPGWTWVNLWATWCAPCVEEMELLGRWREGFSRDGAAVAFELVCIDETDAEKELAAWRGRSLPGPIRWLRSERDLAPLLDALGVERDAMIPVHALVDAAGWLRCVRVGAIHEQDYAAVKALVAPSGRAPPRGTP